MTSLFNLFGTTKKKTRKNRDKRGEPKQTRKKRDQEDKGDKGHQEKGDQKGERGLFIFRRDLRTEDNRGLQALAAHCKEIYTIFIFTPEQVTGANAYKSTNAIQFMIESLRDLQNEINKHGGKLHFFYGKNTSVINTLIDAWKIDVVGCNKDYTPYALKRDEEIRGLCKRKHVSFQSFDDYYLNPPEAIMTGQKEPYKKFTPYYRVAKTLLSKNARMESTKTKLYNQLVKGGEGKAATLSLDTAFRKFIGRGNEDIMVHGGRAEGLRLLRSERLSSYNVKRNDLNYATSHLSAYIKFGCISIREVYHRFKGNSGFVRQLIWRDFYASILFFFPHVLGHAMKPKLNKLAWSSNKKYLEAWKRGETGFPVVDACMRELNTTGYMHNRGRLIVSSFLTKTLLLDWREGERYFAQKLTDYDPASNNGNWQWTASTGVDSQPYFRIFNPWSQSAQYDPGATYIKKWVPELRNVDAKTIHDEEDMKSTKVNGYPAPIVDYAAQKEKALRLFKDAY